MSFSIVKDIVLAVLAVYGAILSTINFRQASLKDKRRVQVKLSTGIPTFDNGSIGNAYFKIEAVNIGHRSVTMTSLSFLVKGRHMAPIQDDKFEASQNSIFPTKLADGESAQILMAYRDVGESLIAQFGRDEIEITPFCEESTGNKYIGKQDKLRPHELIIM